MPAARRAGYTRPTWPGVPLVSFSCLVLSVGVTLGWLVAARSTSGPFSFAPVVERLNPAVVHVDVIDGEEPGSHAGAAKVPPAQAPQRGEGAGFVIDSGGKIVTNHHLVAHARRILVRFADGQEAQAHLVGSDPSTDVALLRIERRGLPTVPLGDSDQLKIGDWVCAIGNPLSFDNSVTVGVVSSKGRKIFNASFDAYIQTDAAINPGNSGGPLINVLGEAVGISSAVSSEGQGIGFAIPINLAREVVEEIERHGRVSRGYLGVQVHDLVPGLGRLLGQTGLEGAVVVDVIPGKAGAVAGLERYDVVVTVNGERVRERRRDDSEDRGPRPRGTGGAPGLAWWEAHGALRHSWRAGPGGGCCRITRRRTGRRRDDRRCDTPSQRGRPRARDRGRERWRRGQGCSRRQGHRRARSGDGHHRRRGRGPRGEPHEDARRSTPIAGHWLRFPVANGPGFSSHVLEPREVRTWSGIHPEEEE